MKNNNNSRRAKGFNISFYKSLSIKIFNLYFYLKDLYHNHITIRLIFKFFYYIYKAIIFISFIFGGGFILTITHIADFSHSMEIIYGFKDVIISNFIHSLIKYISDPSLLSEQAQAKIFNSFPKVEAPQEIPSNDQHLRDKYSKQTFKWYEAEPEVKPFYTEKWFIFGCLSIITIGLTWYFYEDISNFFKPSDDATSASITAKGKFIDSTKSNLDKLRLERMRRHTPSKDSNLFSRTSSTSSTDTITLTNNTKDAVVITSTGDVTNTIASSSNNEASSRLRFTPQFESREQRSEFKSFFPDPNSPDSSSSSSGSSGSLDSPTTHSSKTPFPGEGKPILPGDKGSFFGKVFSSSFSDLPKSDEWDKK
jgi:hypothetical protein